MSPDAHPEEVGPYGRLAAFVLAHRRAVALVAAVITVICALVGLPPNVDSDLLSLLPDDDPSAMALRKLHAEEGGVNLVTLAFSGEDEALGPYLDTLQAEFEALERVQFAIHEIDPDLAFRIGLLQLSPEDVEELTARLQGALVFAGNPIVTAKLMDMGPLAERISLAGDDRGLFRSEKTARLLIRPTGSSHDQLFATAMMDDVQAVLDAHPPDQAGLTLTWIGGAYRHNVEEMRGVKLDILRTSAASLVMVMLVIVLAFRSARATVLVFTPIIVANVVNLALLWLVIGHVNTYTSSGTAVLIGLGIAFSVHLVGRYREERSRGREIDAAIMEAWDRTGPPCTTAAVTSAAGFAALGAGHFRGFSQLGLTLGVGLVICLLATLILLPVLLPILDPNPKSLLGGGPGKAYVSRSTYRLAPVGLMAMVVLTGFVGAARLPELAFEFDVSTLRRDGLAYDELTETERQMARESYSPVVVSFRDRDTLTRDHRRLDAMRRAGQLPHVGRLVSVESVMPLDQTRRLAELEKLAALTEHRDFRRLPRPIAERLVRLRGFEAREITREDVPKALLTLLGSGRTDQHRLLLFPEGNMWDLREAAKLADEVGSALPGEEVTGEYLALASLYRVVLRDMPIIGFLALFLVGAVTGIDLKSVPHTVGAMGALLVGMTWAFAAVQAFDVKLSMLNVVGVPILLGIGIDVVVHLMHRLREEGPGGVRRALATTGVAAFIATLTGVVSFASLLWAGTRGVRSLGMLVVIGLTAIFIACGLLLPMAWAAGWRLSGRMPGATDEGSSGSSAG